jgi:hypothetical protein
VTALLLAALLTATCDAPGVAQLPPEKQAAACALARQRVVAVQRPDLDELYARPGFERARARDTGALDALLRTLKRKLLALFETSGAQTYSNATRVLVLVLALAFALGVALRLSRRSPVARAATNRDPREPLQLDAPGAHLDRARALVTTAPREGLREALLAVLSSLERRRLARPDRVKTNRELVAELPGRGAPPALTAEVGALLADWDAAFYSLAPVTPEAALAFLSRVEPVVTRGAT